MLCGNRGPRRYVQSGFYSGVGPCDNSLQPVGEASWRPQASLSGGPEARGEGGLLWGARTGAHPEETLSLTFL